MEEERFIDKLQREQTTASSSSQHHRQGDLDPNFDRKLDLITAGARPFIKEHLLTRITTENCKIIVDYFLAMQVEVSPSPSYRIDSILKPKHFTEFHNPKSLRDITRQDIIQFLDHLRKPESVDPLHKWIGTHEIYRIVLLRFFRWLHRPSDDIPYNRRPKPAVMNNIPKIKRKEESIYKPTDLWTEEDDALFYKYCKSPRDRCWHAVSRDTGCRPHELLKLKIKDIVLQQREDGAQVARIRVNGKTGTRNVRIYNSYPRLKEWLTNGHPFPSVPDAVLFCGCGKKNTGKRLAPHSIGARYDYYKRTVFPELLLDDTTTVPEEDKRKIRELLKKPWNPHLRRHTAATEISKALKDPKLINSVFGWSDAGKTHLKYQHYFADDAFDAVLTLMDGLLPSTSAQLANSKNKSLLKPKHCPNCDEPNKPESKFCAKCKFVLSFDAFNETMEESEKTKKELEALRLERERDKKALAELVDSRLRQFAQSIDKTIEQRLEAKHGRLADEFLSQNKGGLKKIKDEKKYNAAQSQLLWDAGVAAEVELEEELEEEAAAERLAAYDKEAVNLEFSEEYDEEEAN
jgi:integrase/recombinase XerD